MKQSKTVEAACDILIRKVRFEDAVIRLDKQAPLSQDDTAKIRAATELYTETWIVSMLKMIRDGDILGLRRTIR